jgi:hypothetical protein
MKYIECPEEYSPSDEKEKSIFIAGGISNCSDWQMEFVKLLENEEIVLMNPRRKEYNFDNTNIEEEQISWEFNHLKKASGVSFWFPKETLCPITLYELGKESMKNKPLFIGIDPEYKRKKDVEIQTRLIRPDVKIVYSVEELTKQIKNWIKQQVL